MFLIRMACVCRICTFTLKYPPTHDLVGFVVSMLCFSGFLNAGGPGRWRILPDTTVLFVTNSDVLWYGGFESKSFEG